LILEERTVDYPEDCGLSDDPSIALKESACARSTSTISLRLVRAALKATFMITSVLKTRSILGLKANSYRL
jgi:hypothetical protein